MSNVERLVRALEDLLDDTEHKDHECGDVDCPVSRARAALDALNPVPAHGAHAYNVEPLEEAP